MNIDDIKNDYNGIIFRKDAIVHLCENKRVLHLGYIQHAHFYREKIQQGDWLHEKISEVAADLMGLDYLEEEIIDIKNEFDYDGVYADVTKLDRLVLEDIYDVIVCGELIEHVSNPGLMLSGLKRFCDENTIIIFTTPNPWSKERIRLIRRGVLEEKWLNPEHGMWFSYQTLTQLLVREGYEILLQDYYYGDSSTKYFRPSSQDIPNKLRNIKKRIVMHMREKRYYDGLFFIARVGKV